MKRPRASLLIPLLMSLALLPAAQAGPPLLCFPYQIGTAKSLPWGGDGFAQDKQYDRSHVVADTMELLKTERSTLVRMETLRRAAIYIGSDRALATDLMARLNWIVMDNEAIGKPSGLNWFDAGFLAATLSQSGVDLGQAAGRDEGAPGYLWIQRGLELAKDDAAMQFGAALVVFGHNEQRFKDHLRKAIALAKPGSDLAASIESNWACGHKPIQDLRKELGDARADAKPGR